MNEIIGLGILVGLVLVFLSNIFYVREIRKPSVKIGLMRRGEYVNSGVPKAALGEDLKEDEEGYYRYDGD